VHGGVRRGGNEGTRRSFVAGDVIVQRGDAADEMFVIRPGEVEIRRDGLVARLGPGDFFGEMSLLEPLPRDADGSPVGPSG
jgi:CRP-like cAMP-binding protein